MQLKKYYLQMKNVADVLFRKRNGFDSTDNTTLRCSYPKCYVNSSFVGIASDTSPFLLTNSHVSNFFADSKEKFQDASDNVHKI